MSKVLIVFQELGLSFVLPVNNLEARVYKTDFSARIISGQLAKDEYTAEYIVIGM